MFFLQINDKLHALLLKEILFIYFWIISFLWEKNEFIYIEQDDQTNINYLSNILISLFNGYDHSFDLFNLAWYQLREWSSFEY